MTAALISLVLIWTGIAFIAISAIGILRMPDVYTRMSVVTKAVALGVGFILLGAVVHFGDTAVLIKALIIFVFLVFSLAVAAHVIGSAAYDDRTPMTDLTFRDELAMHEDGDRSPERVEDPDEQEGNG